MTTAQTFCCRPKCEDMDGDGGHGVRWWRGLINALGHQTAWSQPYTPWVCGRSTPVGTVVSMRSVVLT
jgi:hypothetical protein